MEQKKAENNSKELFAYEMTQVILALKGEFAAVSGKKMGCEQNRVSKKARNLPKAVLENTKIPAIEVKRIEMGRGLSEKLAAQIVFFDNAEDGRQSVTVTCPEIELPEVRCVSLGELPSVEMKKPQVTPPKTPKFVIKAPGTELSEIRVELPGVQRFVFPAKQAAPEQKAEEKLPAARPVSVPKAPVVALPKIKAVITTVSVPVQKKPPVPVFPKNLRQSDIRVGIPAAEKLTVEVPSAVQKPELGITMSGSTFIPVKKVDVQMAVPKLTLKKQKIAVPKVPRHRLPQPTVAPLRQTPAAPVIPNVVRERQAFLSVIAEFL